MIILKDQIKVLGGTNFKNFKDQKRYEKKMRE